MSVDAPSRLTPDDLLALPDRKFYELVDGELVELKMSVESSWIAGQIFFLLRMIVQPGKYGWLFPEGTGFRCFADDPNRVRKPDASFVLRDHLPGGPAMSGYCTTSPDLAVEVVSPHDLAWEVDVKVNDWLEAGVSVVWIVMPLSRTVIVYASNRDAHKVTADEEITLDLIPEFRCRVGDFFPPKSTELNS